MSGQLNLRLGIRRGRWWWQGFDGGGRRRLRSGRNDDRIGLDDQWRERLPCGRGGQWRRDDRGSVFAGAEVEVAEGDADAEDGMHEKHLDNGDDDDFCHGDDGRGGGAVHAATDGEEEERGCGGDSDQAEEKTGEEERVDASLAVAGEFDAAIDGGVGVRIFCQDDGDEEQVAAVEPEQEEQVENEGDEEEQREDDEGGPECREILPDAGGGVHRWKIHAAGVEGECEDDAEDDADQAKQQEPADDAESGEQVGTEQSQGTRGSLLQCAGDGGASGLANVGDGAEHSAVGERVDVHADDGGEDAEREQDEEAADGSRRVWRGLVHAEGEGQDLHGQLDDEAEDGSDGGDAEEDDEIFAIDLEGAPE